MSTRWVRRHLRSRVSAISGSAMLCFAFLTLSLVATPAAGVTVQGSFRYAGLPVGSTFTNLKSCVVSVYSYSPPKTTTYLVDPTTGSYRVPVDLAPGQYNFEFLMSPTPGVSDTWRKAGELWVRMTSVTVTTTDPFVLNVDLIYKVHVVSPYDNSVKQPGAAHICPSGPELPLSFTLAWQSVPRAVGYSVLVERWDCAQQLRAETYTPTTMSLPVLQHQVAGELYMAIAVTAHDAAGHHIADSPLVSYSDGNSSTHFMRATTSVGRPVHDATGQFIYQIGHQQGSQGTFWKGDLTLTNPTGSAITADLYFTPRNANGTVTYDSASVSMPARSSRTYTDAVDSLFHTTGFGSIEVLPSLIEAAARSYTAAPNPPGGAYGQGYPPAAANAVAYLDGPTALLGSGYVIKGNYRTNLTLIEVWGETAKVRVRLPDRGGNQIGSGPKEYDIPKLANIQLNDLGAVFGVASLTEGQVTVEVLSGDGRVAGCLSVVDNRSQDPSTLPLVRRFF
jgi:hypothetical protein